MSRSAHMKLLDVAHALADVDDPGCWWTLTPKARARYETMAVVAIRVVRVHDDDLDLETERAIRESCRCVDCGADILETGEDYLVHDLVWDATGLEPEGGMLCVGCVEKRLGRRLRPEDFPDVYINRIRREGGPPRLRSRMLGREEAVTEA